MFHTFAAPSTYTAPTTRKSAARTKGAQTEKESASGAEENEQDELEDDYIEEEKSGKVGSLAVLFSSYIFLF